MLNLRNIKFVKIVQKQRRMIFAALLILVVILILWTVYLWWRLFIAEPRKADKAILEESVSSICRDEACLVSTVRRPVDGLMAPAEEATSSLFAVMLDNFLEARPIAGLSAASLVWEAPVEAGLTRFLAVFPLSAFLPRVGPIRSARPYYLDWAKEIDALYLHVGGSNEALKEVKNKDVFDLNEFYRGWYFWRDIQRLRPFNVFSSSDLANLAFQKEAERQNFAPRLIESWLYKEEAALSERGDSPVPAIDFGQVEVEWKYNCQGNFYERWEDGAAQKDESGAQIIAKNVIFQITEIRILDEVGRRQIKTLGSGRALIFRDGQAIDGAWEKKTLASRTRFFGPDTKEMEFNPGTSWIEVVGAGMVE